MQLTLRLKSDRKAKQKYKTETQQGVVQCSQCSGGPSEKFKNRLNVNVENLFIAFILYQIYPKYVKILRDDPGRPVQGNGPLQGDGGAQQELCGAASLAERGRDVDVQSQKV